MLHGRYAAILRVDLRGSEAGNRSHASNCATSSEISHDLSGSAAKVLWTMRFATVTFFDNACHDRIDVALNWGRCHCLVLGACGEGTKLRLVRSLDFAAGRCSAPPPLCIALPGVVATLGSSAHAGASLEERKLPMQFSWVACQPNCGAGSARSAS